MEPTKEQKDRHKTVCCTICSKYMSSANFKRHMKQHRDLYSLDENDMREEIKDRKRQYENREERKRIVREIALQENAPKACIEEKMCTVNAPMEGEHLEEDMLQDNQKYLETIELGKRVNSVIDKGIVQEESLSKPRKDALDLYRKQRSRKDTNTPIELRPWQKELMGMIATPTAREIIWVRGIRGNEGKSWFQEYLASSYGYARVVQLDLKMKTSNVLHALTKQPLSQIGIFLFNEPRAKNFETCNYSILESIKDGIAVASKYNNDIVHFKTPNIVVVFSNNQPKMKQLSRDRWCVLRITKEGLKDVTKALWKAQNEVKPPSYAYQENIREDWSW